jgi:hypothetical protein
MTTKNITAALILFVCLSAGQAPAASLTPAELAKAQKLGDRMEPPVDITALLAEAGTLGVDCDVSKTLSIKTCQGKIKALKIKGDAKKDLEGLPDRLRTK